MRLLSVNAATVLNAFLSAPDVPRYGYELMQDTGIKSGSLYPVLGRFERLGWINGTLEPTDSGRPPRRVYRFNPECQAEAAAQLDRFFVAKQIPASDLGPWGA
ncbi:MAG: helix-turn-helix transcriptional regulator [Actinomycetota bacterium]